MNVPSHTPFDL